MEFERQMIALDKQRILLGVTGGIAAYKSAELIRRLREAGAEVQVVMTQNATAFITPLTLQALSGRPVRTELMDVSAEAAMGHIELARWAQLILIAPASADFMARLAHGFANDLLSTLCLATAAPIVLAPAMNRLMWNNAAMQANCALLQSRGVRLLGPGAGSQACGEVGEGRMLEPEQIIEALAQPALVEQDIQSLAGLRVLITAGPTREPIDPVRFVSNRSSGKMGFAIANAAAQAGAEVTLISGPSHQQTPPNISRIDVETAAHMYEAVMSHAEDCDVFIATAAVADYRPVPQLAQKMKKHEQALTLQMVRNPDILSAVARLLNPPFTVGFAAETENVEAYAQAKRRDKKIDMIAANIVGEQRGFDTDDNALKVFWEGGYWELPSQPKPQLAKALIALIAEQYEKSRVQGRK
jgi:phosphopantothenoylcysteine decarboxylase/phosphopantothenate--cysteine ligase